MAGTLGPNAIERKQGQGPGWVRKECFVTSFPFIKLAEPSEGEMERSTTIGHEIVAISAVNDSDRMFLKLLCRNGEQTVVWLDAFLVDHLTRHLEKALSGAEQDPLGAIRTTFKRADAGSVGIVPRSHSD
jgi:hypothetical protein